MTEHGEHKKHKNFAEQEAAKKATFGENEAARGDEAKAEQHTTEADTKAHSNEKQPEADKGSELPDETASLKAEIAMLNDKSLRLAAETQNMIRRIKNDHAESVKNAISKFASDLTGPIEMLFLALDSSLAAQDESPQFKTLREGLDMTKNEFIKTFNNHGLHRLCPIGKKFDHNFHQAVSHVEDKEKEPNTIIQVLKAGYTLNDKVLSPAVVVVSKH